MGTPNINPSSVESPATNGTPESSEAYTRRINRAWQRQRKHKRKGLPTWTLILLLLILIAAFILIVCSI